MFASLINARPSHRHFGALAVAAVLVTASGCAADSADDASVLGDSSESIGTTTQAVTSILGGLQLVGNYQIKSGVAGNLCIQAVSNQPVTRTCSTSADQTAAILKLPDNTYQICYPNSWQLEHYESYQYGVRSYWDYGTAICLVKGSSSSKTLSFTRRALTMKGYETGGEFGDWGTGGAWVRHTNAQSILQEPNGVLGWSMIGSSGLKITRDSNNGSVLLWSALGNTSQQWTFIAR